MWTDQSILRSHMQCVLYRVANLPQTKYSPRIFLVFPDGCRMPSYCLSRWPRPKPGTVFSLSLRPRLRGRQHPIVRGPWLAAASAKMCSNGNEKPAEKSYLSSAVDSINPWAGKPSASSLGAAKDGKSSPGPSRVAPVDPGDHSITHLYGQSSRTYPADCPPLNVQWFHAVDVCIDLIRTQ